MLYLREYIVEYTLMLNRSLPEFMMLDYSSCKRGFASQFPIVGGMAMKAPN
jgi:hypothetical protein